MGYLPLLSGCKRTLKPTVVPSAFHWKKGSQVKWKAATRSLINSKKGTEATTVNSDEPTCNSTRDIFVEPQETPFLLSISENLENTTGDQLVGDLQSTICNIQSENEWLCKEIHKVTTLKENFKLEVEELTHQSNNHFMD